MQVSASKPIQINIVQEEIQKKDPRVYNDASWSIKAAWPQKQIVIPPIMPPGSSEPTTGL